MDLNLPEPTQAQVDAWHEAWTEACTKRWYAVVDDLVGGGAVATRDVPASQLDMYEHIASAAGPVAQRIADDHNRALGRPHKIPGFGTSPTS